MKKIFSKIRIDNIYIYFVPFVILYAFIIFRQGLSNFNPILVWDSLYHSDFFINYKSGFIRRGLDGNIIYSLANFTNLNPIFLQKCINLFSFILFLIVIIHMILKNRIVPIIYFFSTGCFLLYIEYIKYGLRKDHLMILYFFVVLKIYDIKNKDTLKYILLNTICIVAILSHEIFFIISILPIFYLFFIDAYRKIIFLLPSIIIFLLTILYKGNILNEQVILESWYQLGINTIHFNAGIFTKPIYIWDIGLTHAQYLGLFLTIFLNFTFLLIALYLKIHINKQILIFIISQYIVCICLCLVGCDFSRWIFFTNITIILILTKIPNLYRPPLSQKNKLAFLAFVILYFFVNTQHIGWSYNIFINNTPINIIVKYISTL